MEKNSCYYLLFGKNLNLLSPSWLIFETPTSPSVKSLSVDILENNSLFANENPFSLAFHDISFRTDQWSDKKISPGSFDPSIVSSIIRDSPLLDETSLLPKYLFVLVTAIQQPSSEIVTSFVLPTMSTIPVTQKPRRFQLTPIPIQRPRNPSAGDLLPQITITMKRYATLSSNDYESNKIIESSVVADQSPGWVQDFLAPLSRRREITTTGYNLFIQNAQFRQDVHLVATIRGRFVCNDNDVMVNSTGQCADSRYWEAIHLMDLTLSSRITWDENRVLDCFLRYQILNRVTMDPDLIVIAEKNKPLPEELGIPANVGGFLLWYQFKPDVCLLRGSEPYLFLEFESSSTHADKARMFLCGSGIVKWMNRVSGFRIVLPLVYIYKNGRVELSLMYEENGNIQRVEVLYSLKSLKSRLEFFTTIFNIIDRDPTPDLSHTMSKLIVELIKLAPQAAISNLPTNPDDDPDNNPVDKSGEAESSKKTPATKKRKKNTGAADPGGPVVNQKRPDDEGGGDGTGNLDGKGKGGGKGGAGAGDGGGAGRGTGNAGMVTRAKAKGTQGGTENARTAREILIQEGYDSVRILHRNILTMTKNSLATRKTNLIAKIVRSSSEQKFYRRQLKHPNVIKSEAMIPSSYIWSIVVLPELVSLESSLENKVSFTFRTISSMCNGLGNGLQFLHNQHIAHMDIKPSNLVYHPTTFTLQIIDFNLSIWVKNTHQTVTGSRGTPGWMAPEVVSGSPFKPMLADLYSCGIVLYRLVDIVWPKPNEVTDADRIRDFSCRLMDSNPSLRPSLNSFTRSPFSPLRVVNH
ncbi:hypothetical protein D9757_012271 [Collybiopsis confluens]|uniref:Protein kinase domain-containing protein n=1 Tax=Collybiopsis confluens TaxID=2823264 RepID=A0A8H5GPA2_9AGAR|nr:hypothetical protein D9757_012271 [Collybiopsis confluens]